MIMNFGAGEGVWVVVWGDNEFGGGGGGGGEWVVVWGENEFGGGGFSPLSGSLALLVDPVCSLRAIG